MRATTTILAASVALLAAGGPALARHRHRRPAYRHHSAAARPAERLPAPQVAADPGSPVEFYPRDIEGGVPGNLPFNNQIRKLTDPLNAFGGK